MANPDKKQLGQAFMEDLLSRIPEADRATPESLLAALMSESVLTTVGEGALRQQDYSREMNRTTAYYRELQDWHAANKAKLDGAATPNPNPTNPTTPAAPGGSPSALSKEALEEQLNERERGQVAFLTAFNALDIDHSKLFGGERLNMQALVTDPEINKLGLHGVYQKQFGQRIADHQKAQRDAEIEAAKEAGRQEARTQFAAQPPYPVTPQSSHVSPLSVLEATPGVSDGVVSKAVAAHNQLVQERMAGGGAR